MDGVAGADCSLRREGGMEAGMDKKGDEDPNFGGGARRGLGREGNFQIGGPDTEYYSIGSSLHFKKRFALRRKRFPITKRGPGPRLIVSKAPLGTGLQRKTVTPIWNRLGFTPAGPKPSQRITRFR